MDQTTQTIEAEVVEIDGIAVEPRPAHQAGQDHTSGSQWRDWRTWHGKITKLDGRWWPLWLLLGFIALILLVAVGMCAAVLILFYKICKGILQGFATLLFPTSQELQRR